MLSAGAETDVFATRRFVIFASPTHPVKKALTVVVLPDIVALATSVQKRLIRCQSPARQESKTESVLIDSGSHYIWNIRLIIEIKPETV